MKSTTFTAVVVYLPSHNSLCLTPTTNDASDAANDGRLHPSYTSYPRTHLAVTRATNAPADRIASSPSLATESNT